MQQAEKADSIRAKKASPGNFGKISAPLVAYIADVELEKVAGPAFEAICSLGRLATLLRAVGDAADAGEKVAKDPSGGSWCQSQFKQLSSLVDIAHDEVGRCFALVEAIDNVTHAHIERRAA